METSSEQIEFLRRVAHLKDLENATLEQIVNEAHWQEIPAFEVLIRQGEKAEHVFIIVHGALQYEIRNTLDKVTARGVMTSGEMLGDVSCFAADRSVATVFSVRKSHVMRIDKEFIKSIFLSHPSALQSVTQKIVHHASLGLLSPMKPLPSHLIALVPVSESVLLKEFAHALSQCVNRVRLACIVTRETIEQRFGTDWNELKPGGSQFFAMVEYIEKLSSDYECVLVVTDYEPTLWREAVLNQVDRILLIADHNTNHKTAAVKQDLGKKTSGIGPRVDLVVIQNGKTIRNTKLYLKSQDIAAHHHVDLENPATMERLARILSGTSIGVALGGGGARAAAHVGLLRAFKEHQIPIDHIGGTSIGAFIAAMTAAGLAPDEVEEMILKKVVGHKLFDDYTLPLVSMVRGSKVSKLFQDIFAEQEIEDLPIDYFATAVNLTTESLTVFDRGPVWKSIRASSSLPAILPPYADQNGLFVDGGLLDNVPGKPMRERGAGFVIAVDVGSGINAAADRDCHKLGRKDGTSPPLLRLLRNKFSHQSIKHPSIAEIIARSMVVGNKERAQSTLVDSDLYIRLPVEDTDLFDFDAAAELFKSGYHYAKKHGAAWKAKIMESSQ